MSLGKQNLKQGDSTLHLLERLLSNSVEIKNVDSMWCKLETEHMATMENRKEVSQEIKSRTELPDDPAFAEL